MTTRNTTIRDKHRIAIAKDCPPCGICGGEILYDLPHTDPRSYVIDHITPLDAGGPDTLDNLQAAHRDCNRAKSNTVAYRPGVTFVTDRHWW